ncbi:hypothetical protein [Bradyrhizobium sp. AUGA SZCCT0160]|uniref:hypothetical protein n=1 Tax=Bradyrhizobium sp. AUGA SZCCT0160 TaxID=2807662 RepID=UPI001BAD260E|nr:hypothetical protein [Bradyrhizobium sp. AUGA SZCCT0160]MBR1189381.1 hypothetical protein [Bradyrhizobium sp. AUGA SZCCT0160]
MFGTTRGTLVPARKHLFALTLAVIASVPVAASADYTADTMVDVRTLPQPEGAVEKTAETKTHHGKTYRLTYDIPASVAATAAATKKSLAADGWVEYVRPLENTSSSAFKRGRQGLNMSVWLGKQSTLSYNSYIPIYANVPFPPGAADILYDERRPYLGCIAPTGFDATLDFFRKEMEAIGWRPLEAAEAAARWPNAQLSETIENGVRAYYSHDAKNGPHQQRPVMLTLQRRDDGRTGVEIRVAPFAMPEKLEAADDVSGLPIPKTTQSLRGSGDSNSVDRSLDIGVVAELPATLAFYRREFAARSWTEETRGAVVTPDNVTLNFSSAEQTATLKLSRRYDMTMVNVATHMKEAALAARAKAKKEADAKFLSDAAAMAKEIIAADEVRRVAQAAKLSDAPLRALADNSKPVPLPENAEEVKFEAADGRLDFYSPSTVRAVAAFYSGALKAQGWKEKPSPINHAAMAVMEFSKGGKAMSLTIMQMGPRAKISGYGSALVVADAKMAAKPGAADATQASSGAKAAVQVLEADPETDADAPFPMPKQRGSTVSRGSGKLPGSNAPFRRELEISVPADLASVLAFYRTELGKRGWKESAERAVVQADRMQLAFASPDGPAQLKLGRAKDETTVSLAQKYTEVAAKAGVIPKPGQARLVFGNMGGGEAAVTINKQTIKLAAGAGGPQSAKPPMLDLPPGKYAYSVKVAGRPARNDTVEVTADDAWGLIIAPSGDALSLQMY